MGRWRGRSRLPSTNANVGHGQGEALIAPALGDDGHAGVHLVGDRARANRGFGRDLGVRLVGDELKGIQVGVAQHKP